MISERGLTTQGPCAYSSGMENINAVPTQLQAKIAANRRRQAKIAEAHKALSQRLRTCEVCGPFDGSACKCGDTFIIRG